MVRSSSGDYGTSCIWYYHHMCISKFGGVTGDLAGYFLQMCEILMALAVVVMEQILLLFKVAAKVNRIYAEKDEACEKR